MRETEEVERRWFAFTVLAALLPGESTETNQVHFLRVQVQLELFEP